MLALALVLLVLVAVLVVASFVGSSEEAVVEFLNVTITTSVGGVFVAGFVAGLIALASLYLIRTSLRRIQKRRQEVQELRQRAEQAPAAPTTAATTDVAKRDDQADDEAAESAEHGPAEEVARGSRDDRPPRDGYPSSAPANTDPDHPPDTTRS